MALLHLHTQSQLMETYQIRATASLTINPVDDAPVSDDITPNSFDEDTESLITLSYSDVESDNATTCALANLTNVTIETACACAGGECTVGVKGTADYIGAASFTYTVTANTQESNSSTASLTIDNTDDAPIADDITPDNFNEDTESLITLSYTDIDSDNATACALANLTNVTIETACACAAGECTVGVKGTQDYVGAASFTYTVTANTQESNSATASLTTMIHDCTGC